MEPLSIITGLINTVVSRIWPDKTEQGKAALELAKQQIALELTKDTNLTNLLTKQMDVNTAEAANPNRKWMTWREVLGYIIVIAVGWQWVGLPFVSYVMSLVGHPVAPGSLFEVDIVNILYVMMGMLGLDVGPVIANRVKNGPAKK